MCGVGTGPEDLQTIRIPTTSPGETMARTVSWFRSARPLDAIGIGSFGPLDLHSGRLTNTPKAGWQDYDLAGAFRTALNVPVAFDTDVNAALLGEATWGAAREISNCIYLTVGTGIGGAALVRGHRLRGKTHPEMGHIRIPHDLSRDPFPGCCPFHGDCLEGLASGAAIESRWGRPPEALPPEHPAWELEAGYLACGLANFACVLSPERIILGGGVMQQQHLVERIRHELKPILAGYIELPDIAAPYLGDRAGVLGALLLAKEALAHELLA